MNHVWKITLSFIIGAALGAGAVWLAPPPEPDEAASERTRERESTVAEIEKYSQQLFNNWRSIVERNQRMVRELEEAERRYAELVSGVGNLLGATEQGIEYGNRASELIAELLQQLRELVEINNRLRKSYRETVQGSGEGAPKGD